MQKHLVLKNISVKKLNIMKKFIFCFSILCAALAMNASTGIKIKNAQPVKKTVEKENVEKLGNIQKANLLFDYCVTYEWTDCSGSNDPITYCSPYSQQDAYNWMSNMWHTNQAYLQLCYAE
jgi:hypothetical protein